MARRMTSPVLVGRTEAVEQLASAYASAEAGDPRHVLLSGEAGVGKTRLLGRSSELVGDAGARVLLGGCVSMGGAALPFAPYAEILRAIMARDGVPETVALAGRGAEDLARLVPSLGTGETSAANERWGEARLFESLLELLRRLSARQPLMLQLEDLHWADAGTLAATAFLFRAIRDEPIVLVCTIRSDEITRRHPLRPWLAEVTRSERVERVELETLTAAESAELVRNITGSELSVAALDDIHDRSDGNPFFVEELLASGVGEDRLLPTSLRDLLLTRVDRLGPSAQQLLGVAAIGGREVDHEILVEVADRPEPDVTEDLAALVDAGLVVAFSTPDRDGYAFRHALVQEAVHDALLPPERRRLHRSYAERLEERGGAASTDVRLLVQVAQHWREARDGRALDASIRAGDAATAAYAFSTAVLEYDHALDLWGDAAVAGDGAIDHVELLARKLSAAHIAGDFRRAVGAGRQAMDEMGNDAEPGRETEIGLLLARALWGSGDWSGALELNERALEAAPPAPHIARIRALSGLGQGYMLFGWLTRSRPYCEEAVELAQQVGARDLEGHGLNTLAVVLAGLGETEAGVEAIDRALVIAKELGLADDIGRAHVNKGDVLAWTGRPRDALESALVGITAAIDLGMETGYGTFLRLNAASYAYAIGDWVQAAELLSAADRSADSSIGTEAYRAEYGLPFLVSSGAAESAATWRRARQMRSEHPGNATSTPTFTAAIELACYEGRFLEAVELAEEGLGLLHEIDGYNRVDDLVRAASWPLAEVGRGALMAGDEPAFRAARDRLDALIDLMEHSRERLGFPEGHLGELIEVQQAHVRMQRHRLDATDSPTGWREVAQRWHDFGDPFLEAYCLWRTALAGSTADQRDESISALRDAHAIAVHLGAKPLLQLLDQLARQLRVRLGAEASAASAASVEPFGLTPREREVLAGVAAGKTNRQIAEALFISQSTAGVHVSNILSKLGVATRTEAASVALSQGLVELE